MVFWPIIFIALSIIITIALYIFEEKPKFTESELLLNENKFWAIINDTLKKSNGQYRIQIEKLAKELKKLSVQEMIEFDNRFKELRGKAYNWDLWGAVYLTNGGCDDDCFYCFREWLISRGKDPYYKTIENPKTLINLQIDISKGVREGIGYVPSRLFKEITNKEIPSNYLENIEISGTQRDEKDLENIFPELYKKYSNRT